MLIILAAIFCKVYFAGPNYTFDDGNYVLYAKQMLNGTYNITETPYAYGSLFIASMAASATLLGTTPLAFALPQILAFILLITCIYTILSYYFSKQVSLFATISIEISTFMFVYATRALPDIPIALIVALIFLIITYKKKSYHMLFAGLLAGLSFFIKFGGAAFLLLILISYIIAYRKNKIWHEAAAITAGLLIGLAIYVILLPAGAHFTTMLNAYSQQQTKLSEASLSGNFYTILVLLFNYNTTTPYFNQVYPIGMIFLYAIAGTYFAFKNKNPNMQFIAIAFWIGFMYLLFGTESITHYTFITVTTRYITLFAAPMAILTGYFFKRVYLFIEQKTTARLALAILVMFVIVLAVSNMPLYLYFFKYPNANYHFVPFLNCPQNSTSAGNVVCH